MVKRIIYIMAIILAAAISVSAVYFFGFRDAGEDVSSNSTSNSTSNISSTTSDISPSSSSFEDVSDVISTTEPSKLQKAILAAEGKDATRKGYSFGLETDELNRPINALNQQEKYKKYNFVALKNEEKTLYLTFDNGWENGLTPAYLDILKEKNVKAVFFINKPYAEKNKAIVKRMIDEGHIIGNHSANHQDLTKLSAEKVANEILDLHNYILSEFGVEMHLFRPPSGAYSERVLSIANALDYKTVEWSFAYADWDLANPWPHDEALKLMKEKLCGGGIYLLHPVSYTTKAVLGEFIDYARLKGYTISVLKNSHN